MTYKGFIVGVIMGWVGRGLYQIIINRKEEKKDGESLD